MVFETTILFMRWRLLLRVAVLTRVDLRVLALPHAGLVILHLHVLWAVESSFHLTIFGRLLRLRRAELHIAVVFVRRVRVGVRELFDRLITDLFFGGNFSILKNLITLIFASIAWGILVWSFELRVGHEVALPRWQAAVCILVLR